MSGSSAGVWTIIRTRDYSYYGWTIRTLDDSYVGLFVRWTFRTTDDSYYGLFVPFTNITYASKANVYMCVSVSRLTLCACIEVILALQITNVRCRYFLRIIMFILSYHCCLFDAVLQYPHVAGNWLSRQLLLGSAVDVVAALTTAKHC